MTAGWGDGGLGRRRPLDSTVGAYCCRLRGTALVGCGGDDFGAGGIGRWRFGWRDWEAAPAGLGGGDLGVRVPGTSLWQRLLAAPGSGALLAAPDGGAMVAAELWWRAVPA